MNLETFTYFLEDDNIDQTLIQPLNVGFNTPENNTVEYFLPSSIPTLSEAEISSWNTFVYLYFVNIDIELILIEKLKKNGICVKL